MAGYVLAVLLHGIWNLAAVSGGQGLIAVFLLVEIPVFLAFIALIVWARRREGRLIGSYLMPYADAGWLSSRRGAHALEHEPPPWGTALGPADRGPGGPALDALLPGRGQRARPAAARMLHSAADAHALDAERRLLDTIVTRRREFIGTGAF